MYNRQEDDSGFLASAQIYNYNPDAAMIRMSTTLLKKYGKKLQTLQSDIERKSQKTKSKELESKKHEYQACMSELQQELRSLMDVSNHGYGKLLLLKAQSKGVCALRPNFGPFLNSQSRHILYFYSSIIIKYKSGTCMPGPLEKIFSHSYEIKAI